MDMQLVTADIDQLAGGLEFLLIIPCGGCLQDEAGVGQTHEQYQHR
jgi:hypothetical protein